MEKSYSSSKFEPKTKMRTTVINRGSYGGGGSIGSVGGMTRVSTHSVRSSFGVPFHQGVIQDMSQASVGGILQTRSKEKHEMQDLNERFASYIEKVRYLEAQNKALFLQIEQLKKSKGFDPSEIKQMYEQEIAEMRKVIDSLTQEKTEFDVQLVSLQDKLDAEKRE